MLQQIIDRRLAGKNKSIGNRERFLKRYREQIRDAVRRAVSERSIRDIDKGETVTVPRKDISEPTFRHGPGGRREYVVPGNREYARGDRIDRPAGGDGQGGGRASRDGEGEDDFRFTLSREEFMQVFFDDLALPNLVRTQLADTPEFRYRRAGFTGDGTPNNIHVLRSMRGALGRRIALGTVHRRRLAELEARLADARRAPQALDNEIEALEQEIDALRRRLRAIPYLDPIDLRYRNRVRVPEPVSKAVMFCVMDVSGSMDEARKDIAKRFFILLYLFLTRHYEKTDIVFIRHHTQADEVGENDFFHATESGGTVVSSALTLMHEIIQARYPSREWNIYCAQASDGDNWGQDSAKCRELLSAEILPLLRYFAYVQVAEGEQSLWEEYARVAAQCPHFAMRMITGVTDIYPVFRELFRKEAPA
ncbi:MAG: YeaH/YhbH family protein [Burkholderiales bacterium]|nr:YeaH/YhbH family protein [Burkholderiales bacterium]